MVSFSKILYWGSKPIVGSYTGTMLKMDVKLHSQFPAGGKIFAANHPSTTDPFFVAAMIRHQCYIMISDMLFQVPVLGAYLRRSGHIPVQEGKGQEAIDAAVERLKEGKTILIFPEGALSPGDGDFCPARTGVARLALASGAPVIPVGVHLEWNRIHTMRSTVKGRVEYSRWYFRGPYNITVGKPLFFKGDVEDRPHVRSVAEKVMLHIIALSRESETRLNPPAGLFETL
jgi:1-acyl-sn-glycerol-3-phosphate acyltransferase